MNKKINEVLKEALSESKPSDDEIKKINSYLKDFLDKFKRNINAEVFVGGSFAKRTLIKREKYDVDIFVRFDKKYSKENISEFTLKGLKRTNKTIKIIHGSRDYFRIDIEPWLCFEIVPVIKVSKPKDASNITDLSYFHVNYINKRVSKRLSDDIILAKSFCHANNIYGAESHIKGFSGYSLELLIYYYKGFYNFIKEISRSSEDKVIIDIEKDYRNKGQILMDMNSSKLESPIILIDPTYKQRNALATLSNDVFKKFKLMCKEFLKKPDISFFKIKKVDFMKMEKSAKKRSYESILLNVSTNVQEGAIAGSKLLKFYNYLDREITKFFDVKDKIFNYENKKEADFLFITKRKNEELIKGPPEGKKKEAEKFKKKHKKTIVKSGRIYAEEKMNLNLREFIAYLKRKNKKIIEDMYITNMKIIR